MRIRAKNFDNWIAANLKEYLSGIAATGAVAGYPCITYYRDTVALYERFTDDIWNALYDDAKEQGMNIPEFIGTFNGAKDVGSDEQFKNLLVWYYVERYAYAKTEGKNG